MDLVSQLQETLDEIKGTDLSSTSREIRKGIRARLDTLENAMSRISDQGLVERRCARLLSDIEAPIGAQEFVAQLTAPAQGTHEERQDRAITRLLRGYSDSRNEWQSALGALTLDASLPDQITADNDYIADLDLVPRLCARHQALAGNASVTHNFLRILVDQLVALEFGIEWLSLSGPGSKKLKRLFYDTAYQALPQHAQFFAGLNAEEKTAQLLGEHQASYKSWRTSLEPQITARNRLVEAYRVFGVGIFFDPFWSVHSLETSRDLAPIFNAVIAEVRETSIVATQSQNTRQALDFIIEAFGATFLCSFLDKKI
ncbi:hypothetical protein B0H11DRAFT_2135205 [Mycena galericulata]|nr:hypothetical protein B0H11DRAFT_2135205 [Mycena galericulata]